MTETTLEHAARELGLPLTPAQVDLLRRYYDELVAWNERLNLTTIVDWEEAQVQHLLDSLSCALVLPAAAHAAPYAIVDIGAGAGFPGIPLKVWLPHAHLTLIESVGKKAAFLRHVATMLALDNVQVVAGRAEACGHDPAHRERYDLAVARAVAALPVLAEYALPLVRPQGLLVAMKGRQVEEEVAAAQGALQALGGQLQEVRPIRLPGLEGPRHLVVVRKAESTPAQFPRRPGIPAKRPLK